MIKAKRIKIKLIKNRYLNVVQAAVFLYVYVNVKLVNEID
ncbi:hypothetical protein CZ794_10100 [Psychrobacter sp. JB385]|nr:hypothetical protein CZ794_10100 [Psychrobacter sp. JB385]